MSALFSCRELCPTFSPMASVDGGITLDVAQEQLTLAIAALVAAHSQQSFAVTSPSGGRSGARPLLEQLRQDVIFGGRKSLASSGATTAPTISARGGEDVHPEGTGPVWNVSFRNGGCNTMPSEMWHNVASGSLL
jgi:hypothetical protein